MATTTRTRLDGGVTFDSTSGALPVLSIPGWGTSNREIAAKVVKDGAPIAVILAPLARWNQSYGGWSRDDEDRFREDVRQIAAHLSGEMVIR